MSSAKQVGFRVMIFTIALVSFTFGCKPNSTSSVESLDSFAGGQLVHQCSGEYTNNTPYLPYITGLVNPSNRLAINESLSALPAQVKDKVFFGGAKTRIEVTNDVTGQCLGSSVAAAYRNQPNQPFLSCHKAVNGEVVIYVSVNANDIRRALVRAIGYYLTEIDMRLAREGDKTVLKPFDDSDAQIEKQALALAFLGDVAASKTFTLSVFSGMISPAILAATSDSARSIAWFQQSGAQAAARNLFADYVFAESVDSYYCSESSRAAVVSKFPRTATMLGLKTTHARAETGFSLFGRGRLFNGFFFGRGSPTGSTSQSTILGTNKPQPQVVNRQPVYALPATSSYYNPNSYKTYTQADLDNLKTSYPGTDLKTMGTIQFDPKVGYTNYPDGGSYQRIEGTSQFVWKNADGLRTGQVVTLNPRTGGWDSSTNPKFNEVPVKTTSNPAMTGASGSLPGSLAGLNKDATTSVLTGGAATSGDLGLNTNGLLTQPTASGLVASNTAQKPLAEGPTDFNNYDATSPEMQATLQQTQNESFEGPTDFNNYDATSPEMQATLQQTQNESFEGPTDFNNYDATSPEMQATLQQTQTESFEGPTDFNNYDATSPEMLNGTGAE